MQPITIHDNSFLYHYHIPPTTINDNSLLYHTNINFFLSTCRIVTLIELLDDEDQHD